MITKSYLIIIHITTAMRININIQVPQNSLNLFNESANTVFEVNIMYKLLTFLFFNKLIKLFFNKCKISIKLLFRGFLLLDVYKRQVDTTSSENV